MPTAESERSSRVEGLRVTAVAVVAALAVAACTSTERAGDPVTRADAASLLASRAESRLAEGREDLAVHLATAAASMDPAYRSFETHVRHTIAHDRLEAARASLAAGDHERAELDASFAATIAGDLDEIQALRTQISSAAGEARRQRLEDRSNALVEEGRQALAEGRFQDAARVLHGALALGKNDDAAALLVEAQVAATRRAVYDALDRGDRTAAIRSLEELLRLEPDDSTRRLLDRLKE